MARTVASAIVTEITGAVVRPILLAELAFTSETIRVWNGIGDITVSSDVFTGIGTLGTVSPIIETATVKATGVDFALSGIPSGLLSIALTEDYQERLATLWLGFMDTSDNSFIDRLQIYKGRMDVMTIEEEGETSTISLSTESILVGLERPRERRYTDQDQKSQFPADKGFEFVTSLQEKDVPWGRT
jgi:hypothetical protein|tara:strand:- start:10 stop:570 length:561 start_codon:yes stop_codon:yes gene_type:complete